MVLNMACKNDILYLETRRVVYNFILNHPGLHLRELERKNYIPFSTLKYHVDYLIKNKLVEVKKINGFSRHYATKKVGKMDKKLLNAFRQESLNRILVVFLYRVTKEYFYKKDFKKLPEDEKWFNYNYFCIKKHRTTILFHLNKLVEMGIVEKGNIKGKTCYKLVDHSMVWDFLIRYQDALSNKRVNNLISCISGSVIPNLPERVMKRVYDIFPHPYHI